MESMKQVEQNQWITLNWM